MRVGWNMKTNLKKLLGSVIMGISIFSLLGCNATNENQAQTVEELLKEKYGMEFEVSAIKTEMDSTTTIVHPKNNENIHFRAFLEKNGELSGDNFIARVISNKINEIAKGELGKAGIDSESFTVLQDVSNYDFEVTDPSIELGEYISGYKPKQLVSDMIIKENSNLNEEVIEATLNKLYTQSMNTNYTLYVYVLSEEEYEKCKEEFIKISSFTPSFFNDYTLLQELVFTYDENGLLNKSENKGN